MIYQQIKDDSVTALKAGQSLRVSVLRMLVSEANYKQIELQHDLNDAEMLAVLSLAAKKRRESIEAYTNAGRPESAAKEAEELKIIEEYLPAQMSESEVRAELGKMDLPKDFSAAMRLASPAFRGRADGGMVARIVKELCSVS